MTISQSHDTEGDYRTSRPCYFINHIPCTMRTIIFLVLALFLGSCGDIIPRASKANRKLRRAERLIKQAELLGAQWKKDTAFAKVAFKVPGIKVEFTPKILSAGKPMVFTKDSVITKVLIVKGKAGVDTVYVDTKCPDRVVTKIVPVEVNNTIKAEKSFWQRSWLFFVGVLVGAIAIFWLTKLGPGRNLNITVDNKKQDS